MCFVYLFIVYLLCVDMNVNFYVIFMIHIFLLSLTLSKSNEKKILNKMEQGKRCEKIQQNV